MTLMVTDNHHQSALQYSRLS